MSQKNAEALLGAFVVIVQVASKCDPRGTLLRGPAMPHTAASIARITRFSEKTIQQCLTVCCDPEVGWIICENANETIETAVGCDDPASTCDDPAGECLEGKGREGKGKNGSVALSVLEFLNKTAEREFRGIDTNLDLIKTRLSEVGEDADGVRAMIVRQCALWKGDATMDEYLRPETLFRKSKFPSYYANRNLPVLALKKPEAINPRNAGIGGDQAKRTAAVVAKVAAMQRTNEQP